MIALFDQNGRCREIHSSTDDLEDRWPHSAEVPDTASPDDLWLDLASGQVLISQDVDPVQALGIPAVIETQPSFSFQVPTGCVVEIAGKEFTGTATIDASRPRRVPISLYGRLRGRMILAINSYAEFRAAEYPSIQDQLDAIWKGGAEMAGMKAKIDAVKARHPKPNTTNIN